jgi:hypothetical protein
MRVDVKGRKFAAESDESDYGSQPSLRTPATSLREIA